MIMTKITKEAHEREVLGQMKAGYELPCLCLS